MKDVGAVSGLIVHFVVMFALFRVVRTGTSVIPIEVSLWVFAMLDTYFGSVVASSAGSLSEGSMS